MKISLLATLVGCAVAFAPAVTRTTHVSSTTLSALPGAAKSAEEDLELTRKVIMASLESEDDGSGIDDSDEEEPAAPEISTGGSEGSESSDDSSGNLWSVDYDATVKLAYQAAGSEGDFDAFKSKYLEEMSAMVAKKGLL